MKRKPPKLSEEATKNFKANTEIMGKAVNNGGIASDGRMAIFHNDYVLPKKETEKLLDTSKIIEKFKELDTEDSYLSLKNNGLGSLKQIADMLWKEMHKEIERNGYSDLTLNLEGAVIGLEDIIKLNNIVD